MITSGEATNQTLASDTNRLLNLINAAISAGISLIQLREKKLSARALYQLAASASRLTNKSATRLLVNDRADIALAAGADGVHLATNSIHTASVRRAFGESFLIGVSTHSLAEARAARAGGADFAVFGPIFHTPAKSMYGEPPGLEGLREASRAVSPFPLIALGGITPENAATALAAGAQGVAAIRALSRAEELDETVRAMRGKM